MHNTVELKNLRTKVKAERKALAGKVVERDLSDEEQAQFDAMSAQINALSKRIDTLEAVQDQDDEDEVDDQAADDAADDTVENSRERSKPKHLDFQVSTSKTRKDSGRYNIQRAIRQACDFGNVRDGIEAEYNQEINRSKRGKGFWLPMNAPLAKPGRAISRDLTTTTGAGGINYHTADTLIDLLRSRLIVDDLGITVRTDLRGIEYIPRQNAASQTYMIGEGVSETPSNPTYNNITLIPKTIGADVPISRKFIYEASFDAQNAVEDDMTKVMARGIQQRIFNGTPVNEAAAITGILQRTDVNNYVVAADTGNGGPLSYQDAVNIEGYVADQNIDTDTLKWAMTNGLKAKLKSTPMVIPGSGGTAYPSFVYGADNVVNGYPVYTTSDMPKGLTKGTATNCHSAIFGSWADAMLGLWSDIDIVVDPYTYKKSGAIEITMLQEIDFQLMHPAAWVVITDATVS